MVSKDSKKLSESSLSTKAEASRVQTCSKCGSPRIIHDPENAETACLDCGFVTQQKVVADTALEGENRKEQDLNSVNTGVPLTYTIYDKNLSTIIDCHKREGYSKNSVDKKAQVYRLRKWQRRIRVTDSAERNLVFALSEITKMSNNLNLSRKVLETASVIYREALKERLTVGHSIQSVASAALYLACRQCELPISLDEIAQSSTASTKEIGKSYRCIIKKIDYATPPLQPEQYITKFFNQLVTQEGTQEVAHKILSSAKDLKLTSGHDPRGIAAAASYAALVLMGEHKTLKEIAEIAHVTEITIRKRYKEFEKYLELEPSI
ncbi:MAG: transcription initiation factor IIB [Nitrososphaerota archaeon]|jgi:transcription initiation factor TFIIB|nr:transcription initiation factor IIB [Nitrososphaerota archaeon]